MLTLSDLTFSIAGQPLLQGASARIPSGARVGLVGRNGSGKTTLFRLLRGELTLDGGEITLPPRARIGPRLSHEQGIVDPLVVVRVLNAPRRAVPFGGLEHDHALAGGQFGGPFAGQAVGKTGTARQ